MKNTDHVNEAKTPLPNGLSPALPAPEQGLQADDELAEKALRAIREWQGNDEAIPDYETINTLADELESRQAYTRLVAALLPIAKAYPDDHNRWIFTFGSSHVHPSTGESLADCYTVINGTVNESREVMEQRVGKKWAFQYPTEEMAGVEKYNLRRIELMNYTDQSNPYECNEPKCRHGVNGGRLHGGCSECPIDNDETDDDPDVHYNVGWVDGVESSAKLAENLEQYELAILIRELKQVAENDGGA